MASSLISNAIQINFDSVLGISDNDGMVNMFNALEASGLRGFLGCPSTLYERELEQFFDTDIVQEGDITCAVSGKYVAISESSIFSQSIEPVSFSCKKRLLKYEYRLLNDILAKSLTVKAGSFDAVTHERFLMMTVIHFGIKVNWSKILFEVFKEMVDKTIKRAKGFAVQICVLLKLDPAITLGDATTFPQLKILSVKTVSTYVSTNKTIDSSGETVDPGVAKVAIVRKKAHLPKIAATDKGKKPLEESDIVQGHPAREQFQLIYGDIDFLILLREKVITEMTSFFRSFSLRNLKTMRSVEDILSKEERMLAWAETDSLETAIQRRLLIIARPREILFKINNLEKTLVDALSLQDQAFRGLIKSIRQEAQNQADVSSIELKAVRAQNVVLMTDLVDTRKEVKDHKAELFQEMDERLATIRSELLDFHAQAQENHLNLSTQLGFLVDYINRDGDAKKGYKTSIVASDA
ncbi:hypothetical protein F511_18460 [Dorcoceras hygrometricum]|uniref:Uncharacterized protein n=1 Tax=Dorcoceras hygrometricum TaxID=472368 RepID=A0A2Z7BJX2_9LAMI|nr:hypothetical protein F511_18460 [Dorcoceras hygrometricum]